MSESTTPAAPTPLAAPAIPTQPVGGDAYAAYHDAREVAGSANLKAWMRRELVLLGEGKGQDEREKEKP